MIRCIRDLDATRLASRRRRLTIDYDFCERRARVAKGNETSSLIQTVHECGYRIRRQFLPHYFQSVPRWRLLLRRSADRRVFPDFGVIGTMKSGTTDLAATLMSHPNVAFPLVKEFDSANPLEWRKYYPTQGDLRRLISRYGICMSPFVGPYLHCLDVASTLSSIRPYTKIVINLRDPSDLVFSEWKWTVLHTDKAVQAKTPFLTTFSAFVDKALDIFPGISGPVWAALHTGIYCHSVAHWINCFGAENVCIFDISDYFASRERYMERLCQFLGLPHIVLPADLPIPNSSPIATPPPTSGTKAKLHEFFEPYNRRLWDILGTTYAW